MSTLVINIQNHISGTTFKGYKFNATNESGVAYSLVGASPSIVFRYGSDTGTIISTMTIGSGLEWVDQALGKFKISLQVISWNAGKYFYECDVTLADTTIQTPFKGGFSILNQINP